MRAGLGLKLTVRNAGTVTKDLLLVDATLRKDLRSLIGVSAQGVKRTTQELAPVDTGFMRDHVTTWIAEGGLSADIGWQASDFADAGFAPYYIFQEFGTVKMAAQPSLFPAYAQERPIFERNVLGAVRRAVARGRA